MDDGFQHSSITDEPNILWSEHPQPLKDILEENSLPLVVKIWTENKISSSFDSANDDIHQPLLLYKETRGKKIYAQNVTSVDVLTGAVCKEDGLMVVLPLAYTGWFRLIDDVEKPLTTISNVARIMPVRFLSCKATPGFIRIQAPTASNPDGLFSKLDVPSGVYTVKNIHEDFVRYSEKKKVVKRIMRCLECYLEDNTQILLPFESEGTFYLIETRKTSSKRLNIDHVGCVYSIKSMIDAGLSRGVILNLMHGRPPSKACGFTNVIKVCELIKDHTVVACTLTDSKRLLELPVAPKPLFIKAMNTTDLYSNTKFSYVHRHLKKYADDYLKELKVRYNYSVDSNKTEEK